MTRSKPAPRYKVSIEMAGGPVVMGTYHSSEIAKQSAQNTADLRRLEVSLHHITTHGEDLIAIMKPRGID